MVLWRCDFLDCIQIHPVPRQVVLGEGLRPNIGDYDNLIACSQPSTTGTAVDKNLGAIAAIEIGVEVDKFSFIASQCRVLSSQCNQLSNLAVLRNYSYFRKSLTNLHAPAKLES